MYRLYTLEYDGEKYCTLHHDKTRAKWALYFLLQDRLGITREEAEAIVAKEKIKVRPATAVAFTTSREVITSDC